MLGSLRAGQQALRGSDTEAKGAAAWTPPPRPNCPRLAAAGRHRLTRCERPLKVAPGLHAFAAADVDRLARHVLIEQLHLVLDPAQLLPQALLLLAPLLAQPLPRQPA